MGVVVFILLIVINFVVITKGAGRIAEVSARFTLDALPGKQMAIDAELNAGIIDEVTAEQNRTISDLAGAMTTVATLMKVLGLVFLVFFGLLLWQALGVRSGYGAVVGLGARHVLEFRAISV